MKTVFKHIPKTAGESIRQIMPDDTLFVGHDYYHPEYKHLYFDIEKYLQRFVIAFVRNPYDRVVSAFHYLNNGGNSHIDKLDKDKYIEKYNGSFDCFVKNSFPYIKRQIHFMSQYSWVYFKSVGICNFIGKYETIQDDIVKLSNIINLKNMELPLLNKSEHKHYENYYTRETKKIVYEQYKNDFKFFGYEE